MLVKQSKVLHKPRPTMSWRLQLQQTPARACPALTDGVHCTRLIYMFYRLVIRCGNCTPRATICSSLPEASPEA